MTAAFAARLTKPTEINFNDRIRLKLHPLGWKLHRQYHFDLFKRPDFDEAAVERAFPYRKPEIGADGYCEFHLWEVAQIFGKNLYNGCEPPFELSGVLIPSSFAPEPTLPVARDPSAWAKRELDLGGSDA